MPESCLATVRRCSLAGRPNVPASCRAEQQCYEYGFCESHDSLSLANVKLTYPVSERTVEIIKGSIPKVVFKVNTGELDRIANTRLGKKIVISSRREWADEEIIEAYHSQYVIEHAFKDLKGSRHEGSEGVWWPMNHWTDQKIHVHGLYCSIAALLRSLVLNKVRKGGVDISMGRMTRKLAEIREVVNVCKPKGRKKERVQTTLTKLDDIQRRILKILKIERLTTF